MSESEHLVLDFDELPKIKPFPEIANRILKACDDPSATSNTLCELIQGDPGISLKIIEVANSSAYGLSGEVRTLQHAVVVLGFRALKNLALSVAASDVFNETGDSAQARAELWEHSLAVACIANALSGKAGISAEEAFLSGVVHDAGKLVLLDVAPEQYVAATESVTFRSIVDTERTHFGTDHQELGMRCADEWGLPFEISEAMGSHHNIVNDEDNDPLVELVGLSGRAGTTLGVGRQGRGRGFRVVGRFGFDRDFD